MFFLAGLLGMMALGSVVIASTGGVEEEEEFEGMVSPDAVSETGETAVTEGDLLDGAALADEVPGGVEVSEDPGGMTPPMDVSEVPDLLAVPNDDDPIDLDEPEPTSLFARMGLINLIGDLDAADAQVGTGGTDLLNGTEADDVLHGAGGADVLCGGEGDDSVFGDAGDDTLHGDGGDDLLAGGEGDDTLFGHHGNDSLAGDDGSDVLIGGLGDDLMDGGADDDALHGREGADTLVGGLGKDTLFGGWDNDLLSGVVRGVDGADMDGQDFLNGGDGDDTIGIGSGDVVHGGDGADVLVLGDWITGDASELADYDSGEDQLVIVYDDADGAGEPELEIRVSATDPAVTEIVMDGQVLTTMPTADAPAIESLVLIGESVAAQMALA